MEADLAAHREIDEELKQLIRIGISKGNIVLKQLSNGTIGCPIPSGATLAIVSARRRGL